MENKSLNSMYVKTALMPRLQFLVKKHDGRFDFHLPDFRSGEDYVGITFDEDQSYKAFWFDWMTYSELDKKQNKVTFWQKIKNFFL